jgi:hypothetical protein
MKHWAQFYRRTDKGFTEAVGDRSVIFIDGRLSDENKKAVASEECRKRGYDGWRLARGFNFLNPFYLTANVEPPADEPEPEQEPESEEPESKDA